MSEDDILNDEGAPLAPSDLDRAEKDSARKTTPDTNAKRSHYDDDREYMALAGKLVKDYGGTSPLYYESTVPLRLFDGRASDLQSWLRGAELCFNDIRQATEGLSQPVVVIKLSDQQEHGEFFKDQDRRRADLQKTIKTIEEIMVREAPEYGKDTQHYKEAVIHRKTIVERLKRIDDEVAHLLGMFHATMAAIRGWSASHAQFTLKGMLEWAGLGFAYDAITSCKYGYYKMSVDVLNCAHIACGAEGLRLCRILYPDDAIDEANAGNALSRLCLHSTTYQVFWRALMDQTAPILDVDVALRRRGEDAADLVDYSELGLARIYTTGGNHNYRLAAMVDLRSKRIAPEDQLAAIYANATVVNRKTQRYGLVHFFSLKRNLSKFYMNSYSNMAGDQGMENYAIRTAKNWLRRPHASNVIQSAELLNALGGRIASFLGEFFNPNSDSFYSNARNEIDIDAVTAAFRASLRHTINDTVCREVRASRLAGYVQPDESQPYDICAVPAPGEDVGVVHAEPTYVFRFNEVQRSRVEAVAKHVLRTDIGGQEVCEEAMRHFCALHPYPKSRQRTVQQLQGDSRRLHGALSLMCANGFNEMNRPHCVQNKHGYLWHNAKSKFKLALIQQFFQDAGESTPWLCARGATVSGSTVKRNALVHAGSQVTKIDVFVHDGPCQIRRARPHTSTLENPTGFGQIADLVVQFCGADLLEGVLESYFGFDVGFCLQKKTEEDSRNKENPPPSSKPVPFTSGDLGNRTPTYLQGVFSDRSAGGGRQQIQAVAGELMQHAALHRIPNGDAEETLKKMLRRGPQGCCVGMFGVGKTLAEVGLARAMCLNAEGELSVVDATVGSSHHKEDTALIYIALQRAALLGKTAVIRGTDVDILIISLLAVAKLWSHITGRLIVQLDDDEYWDCNIIVPKIEADPRLEFIDHSLRVATVVAMNIFNGGDTTHSIRGITQVSGLKILLKHVAWIGEIVRFPSEDDLRNGKTLVLNWDAYQKMAMIVYAERDHAVFVPKAWPGMGVAERGQALLSLGGYEAMEKLMAKAKIPDVQQFMLSLPNLKFAYERAQARLITWYNADTLTPLEIPLCGFDIHVRENDHVTVIRNARQSEINCADVVTVMPTFEVGNDGQPFNRSLEFYFGEGGVGAAVAANIDSRAKAMQHKPGGRGKCKRCRHKWHGDNPCSICKVPACIDRNNKCERCGHDSHKGSVCSICKPILGKKRAHCIPHCDVCEHAGLDTEHAHSGCRECKEGLGCNSAENKNHDTSNDEIGSTRKNTNGTADMVDPDEDDEDDNIQSADECAIQIIESIHSERMERLLEVLDGAQDDITDLLHVDLSTGL